VAEQGKYTYRGRWRRERERSPEIDAIPVGGAVERTWRDKTYRAQNCDGYWLFNRKKYPTLYKVVCAIVGEREFDRVDGKKRKMCNWSAARFFRLNDLDSQT
jgi:hypothetical protein